jgi:hypothetical protein
MEKEFKFPPDEFDVMFLEQLGRNGHCECLNEILDGVLKEENVYGDFIMDQG